MGYPPQTPRWDRHNRQYEQDCNGVAEPERLPWFDRCGSVFGKSGSVERHVMLLRRTRAPATIPRRLPLSSTHHERPDHRPEHEPHQHNRSADRNQRPRTADGSGAARLQTAQRAKKSQLAHRSRQFRLPPARLAAVGRCAAVQSALTNRIALGCSPVAIGAIKGEEIPRAGGHRHGSAGGTRGQKCEFALRLISILLGIWAACSLIGTFIVDRSQLLEALGAFVATATTAELFEAAAPRNHSRSELSLIAPTAASLAYNGEWRHVVARVVGRGCTRPSWRRRLRSRLRG